MAEAMVSKRKRVEEETMCPRLKHNVEEQIRRDGLKEGFAQLDAVLPRPPTKKSRCQQEVLDTAAQYIQDLEQVPNKYEEKKKTNEEMEARVRELEDRLRKQSAASTPDPAMANSSEEKTPDPLTVLSMANNSSEEKMPDPLTVLSMARLSVEQTAYPFKDPFTGLSMARSSEIETADAFRGLLDVFCGVQDPHSPDPDSSPMDFCSGTLWDGNDLDSIYESYLGKIE